MRQGSASRRSGEALVPSADAHETDSVLTASSNEEKLPGRWVFSILVGCMLILGLLFIVLFLFCLVLMVFAGNRPATKSFGTDLEARLLRNPPRIRTIDGIRAAIDPSRVGTAKGPRAKAAILILTRNRELRPLLDTLREFEDRFNKRFDYPYVFLNDQPFVPDFEYSVRSVLRGRKVRFGQIPVEHWSVPPHINSTLVAESRRRLKDIIHGGSLSYRHMCRWFSGFFFDHDLLREYEWFWRVEPGVTFPCDIAEDPFTELEREGKVLGFTIAMSEIMETIPGLWGATQHFARTHKGLLPRIPGPKSLMGYFTYEDEGGELEYNGCHFWNNFEVGSLKFFRSDEYRAYFKHLDAQGGFFYERWGDAPVHSLAAALLLSKDQVMHMGRIGYRHEPSGWCPEDPVLRRKLLCRCDPYDRGDVTVNSCMRLWHRFMTAGAPEEELDPGVLDQNLEHSKDVR